MKIKLAQLEISKDIKVNKQKILEVLSETIKGEWVIFPEGMISGYFPENNDFINSINTLQLNNALEEIKQKVEEKECICLIGSVKITQNGAFNSTYIFSKNNSQIYDKCNLSTLDRKHFIQGSKIQTFQIDDVKFGVQMCRENVFPEQWLELKQQGAQIIFHINNAVAKFDGKRKHLLISRAMENQIFVISVNAVTDTSPLASFVINPYGEVVYESNPNTEKIKELEINLEEVKNTYFEQKREDLIKIVKT